MSRTRNFATVIFEESAPVHLISLLGELCVPCFLSPLHDKDINPFGEPKKAHYHLLIMFEGVKTIEQAREVIEQVGGVGCECIKSIRAYARYLCHLDNPDKAQYPIELVQQFGGADYQHTIGLSKDKYKAISEMMDFCEENGIYSYSKLLTICRYNHFDWFVVLCDSGTFVIKEFLKSKKEDLFLINNGE